jgi:hypothetical protein
MNGKGKLTAIVAAGLLLGWWFSPWSSRQKEEPPEAAALPDFGVQSPVYGLREGEIVSLRFEMPGLIGDAELAVLPQLAHLEVLDLRGTCVTDAGLAHVSWLRRLRELYLDGTRVSQRGVNDLLVELPGCNIWWQGRNWNDGKIVPRAMEIRAAI